MFKRQDEVNLPKASFALKNDLESPYENWNLKPCEDDWHLDPVNVVGFHLEPPGPYAAQPMRTLCPRRLLGLWLLD